MYAHPTTCTLFPYTTLFRSYYYADVASAGAKLVRWLLFLPGGDREKGLTEMSRVRDGGELLRGEADYQLHLIYVWYRSEEHTSELQSLRQLVCRLLLEKKK